MSFVRLENLNDFIQPSTTCIKPVEKKQAGLVAKVSDISLSDCLACSGCITSAESVLVAQQNYEELFKVINENKTSKINKEIVVSLSLQSISSLAHKYNLEVQDAAGRIASFFVSLGCQRVYDINLARHLALIESYEEYRKKCTSRRAAGDESNKIPIISSICPGWICYAEKTNGELVIPHLSRVRSPQQIMGSLLKRNCRTKDGVPLNRDSIYHVTLMPCFDKKLEASRQDFKDPIDGSMDVDCVLTPIELEEILNSEEVTLSDFSPRKLDLLMETGFEFDSPLTSHFGSVSGGYAENILVSEARNILKKQNKSCDNLESQLKYSYFKNSDFIEVSLDGVSEETNEQLPKMAIVNGFRNIQTVVQRLKRKALKYDYIEIMACPSGCINGGAQCRPNFGEDQEKMVMKLKELYSTIPAVDTKIDSEASEKLYVKLNLDGNSDQLLYTDFYPVPKMQNLTVNW